MQSAVVIGGSGFLGSHVADALTEQGYGVAIFDRRPSSYAMPNHRMIVGDILDSAAVLAALKGADVVYHFAGLADLDDASTKPLDTIERNIAGTAIILDAAAQARVKRFVYASTIYVYSALGGFYRCSKQAGELYVEEYQRRYGLNYTILRYGTLYGPRSDMRNSLHRYLRQGLLEGKIQFFGSKDDIREYVHVRDAARLSVEILSATFQNQHVIITGHHQTRATDLLNMIQEILDRNVAIEFSSIPNHAHYATTPYSFIPRIGNKLVSNSYVDMGQGLLECLHEINFSVNVKNSSVPPSVANQGD
jgi:UDP-glucose 4-epimerase